MDISSGQVREALKNWNNSQITRTSWNTLLTIKARLAEGASLQQAVNQLLRDALAQLEAEGRQEARVLRLRYLDRKSTVAVVKELNYAEATIYRWQKAGFAMVAKILQDQESKLRDERTRRLLERLESSAPNDLIGVEPSLERLSSILSLADAPWLISIEGMGGIGKTALADALIRLVLPADIFDDIAWISARQRFFSARGKITSLRQPALSVEVFVDRLLAQLSVKLPSSLTFVDKQRRLQQKLKAERCLLVVDNLETAADVASLLPVLRSLANPSKFLLTSRQSLRFERDVFAWPLAELSERDAVALMRREARIRNVPELAQAAPQELALLYRIVGGNPLALHLLVGQSRVYTLQRLTEVFKSAQDLKAENLHRYIYSRSWNSLSEAGRLLLLFMLLSGEDGAKDDFLESISTLTRQSIADAVDELIECSLLERREVSRRLRIHHLTRAFLETKLNETAEEAYRQKFGVAVNNGLRYALEVISGKSFLSPAEIDQILQILSYALRDGEEWSLKAQVLLNAASKLERAGYREEWLPFLQKGLSLAQMQGDSKTEAALRRFIGGLYDLLGRYDEAIEYLRASQTLYARLGMSAAQVEALNRLAFATYRRRDFFYAGELARHALDMLAESDPERGRSYFVLGAIALDKEAWAEAEMAFRQSYNCWLEAGNKRMTACSLNNLGLAARGQARYDEAERYFYESIQLHHQIKDPINGAVAQMNLGWVCLQRNEPQRALSFLGAAEEVLLQTGEALRLGKLYYNFGQAYNMLQDRGKSLTCFERSIDQFKTIASVLQAQAMEQIALIYEISGEREKAQQEFEACYVFLKRQKQDDPLVLSLTGALGER